MNKNKGFWQEFFPTTVQGDDYCRLTHTTTSFWWAGTYFLVCSNSSRISLGPSLSIDSEAWFYVCLCSLFSSQQSSCWQFSAKSPCLYLFECTQGKTNLPLSHLFSSQIKAKKQFSFLLPKLSTLQLTSLQSEIISSQKNETETISG